jgi:protein phosphatase
LSPAEAAQFLVHLANLRGGPDNTTIVLARINAALPNTVELPKQSNPPPGNQKFLIVLAGLGAILLLVSLLLIAAKSWWAIAPAIAGLVMLLVPLFKLTSGPSGIAPQTGGVRYGKGPYTQTDCAQSAWELVNHLKHMVQQIRDEATARNWKLDHSQLATLLVDADKGQQNRELRSALRNYALAVSNLMDQLRSQPGAAGTAIDL